MIYFKYNQRAEILDSDGAYFMPDTMWFATSLLDEGIFSTEVNIINKFYNEYFEKGKDLTFIDIGANVGTYTMVLGDVFQHSYAFEPDVHTYNLLCGNIALHNLSDKTTLVNAGLSDKEEVLKYHCFDTLGGNNMFSKDNDSDDISNKTAGLYYTDDYYHTKHLMVKTLDSFDIKNVGLIKIDVEGFELNVLKGAKQTIINSNYPPLIVESWNVEASDNEETVKVKTELRTDLFDYIREMGYEIEHLSNDIFYCKHND